MLKSVIGFVNTLELAEALTVLRARHGNYTYTFVEGVSILSFSDAYAEIDNLRLMIICNFDYINFNFGAWSVEEKSTLDTFDYLR